jgi:hypothetical protein
MIRKIKLHPSEEARMKKNSFDADFETCIILPGPRWAQEGDVYQTESGLTFEVTRETVDKFMCWVKRYEP